MLIEVVSCLRFLAKTKATSRPTPKEIPFFFSEGWLYSNPVGLLGGGSKKYFFPYPNEQVLVSLGEDLSKKSMV